MYAAGKRERGKGERGKGKGESMVVNRYGDPVSLSGEQRRLLEIFGLPSDFSALSDEQYFAIDDKMTEEMQLHGINDAGNGLNEYGELCRSVIVSLPDD